MAEKKYLMNGKEQTAKELFNEAELSIIENNQKLVNDAGYGDIDITLLTLIEREVSRQKLYMVDPEDYLPIDHTNGGWNDYITVLRSYYNIEGDIASWERGVDADNARRGQVGAMLDSVPVRIHNYNKMVSYSMFELRQSMESRVWNVVTEKEMARKKDHDISVQSALLLGDSGHLGLLNQTEVPVDTTVLTKPISTMTAVEFKTFLASVFGNYYAQTGYTAMPDTLAIATSDFMGLGVAVDEQYPVFTTMYQRLTDVFRQVTGNPNARIIPLVYCEPRFHNGNYRYVLYRKDFDTLRVYNPYEYNVVQGASVDGINYQNTAFSRISGVFVNRPQEMLYMDFPAPAGN